MRMVLAGKLCKGLLHSEEAFRGKEWHITQNTLWVRGLSANYCMDGRKSNGKNCKRLNAIVIMMVIETSASLHYKQKEKQMWQKDRQINK